MINMTDNSDEIHDHQNPQNKELNNASDPRVIQSSAPRAMTFRFPKSARMKAGGPYERLFKVRQVVSDDLISIHVIANRLDHHRLGLGVAKKMFRKAVQRNRIKRLIREAFRLERPDFRQGLDIVVRPKVKELNLTALRESLKRLVPKAERKYMPRPNCNVLEEKAAE